MPDARLKRTRDAYAIDRADQRLREVQRRLLAEANNPSARTYGMPWSIGVDEPLTYRIGAYVGLEAVPVKS